MWYGLHLSLPFHEEEEEVLQASCIAFHVLDRWSNGHDWPIDLKMNDDDDGDCTFCSAVRW